MNAETPFTDWWLIDAHNFSKDATHCASQPTRLHLNYWPHQSEN